MTKPEFKKLVNQHKAIIVKIQNYGPVPFPDSPEERCRIKDYNALRAEEHRLTAEIIKALYKHVNVNWPA